jgi:hypothetical protein
MGQVVEIGRQCTQFVHEALHLEPDVAVELVVHIARHHGMRESALTVEVL